jgi:hypothetical protein
MKKLLSLLLMLAVATTAFADCYFYIDDYQVKRSDVGSGEELVIPIKASFSARVSGFDLNISYPEHMVPTYIEAGSDLTLSYKNGRGRDATSTATLAGDYNHVVAYTGELGFWQDPNAENPTAWVNYGVIKWEAGEHEEMLLLYFNIEEGFEGGDIVFKTECSSGKDTRGGTVLDNGEASKVFEHVSHISLQPVTATPEITYVMDDDKAVITATGEGEVLLYANGEPVENPCTVARGDEDVVYTFTATAQGEGMAVSEQAELELTVPAKLPAVYGEGILKMWSVNNIPAELPVGTGDVRQGFGMNGKFYINSKSHVLDTVTNTYITVPTVYVIGESGKVESTYPGGLNCGITRDEAGNLVISDAQFPNAWTDAKIKVINPETNVTKEYTVPAECGLEGRCDFLGFAKGNLMEDGTLYLAGVATSGVAIMTITGGEVNTDECRMAACDGVSPTSTTVVNYFKNANDEDALLYVTRNAAPLKMTFDGEEIVPEALTLPNKGFSNGAFPFVWNGKEYVLYPYNAPGVATNYLDGFAIAEIGSSEVLYSQAPTVAAAPSGNNQCNWLNAEVDEEGLTVYQYYVGGYVAVYRVGTFERTQKPVITYQTTDDGVTITATGSGEVLLYVDGEPVENPYTIPRGEEDVTVTITATAHQSDKLVSEEESATIVIPALPAKTAMPIITFNTTDEEVVITATGDGEVLLYVDGNLVENPYTIARGETDVTVVVTATAQEEGKRVSDPAEQTLVIPAILPKTDMPVITFNTTDEEVVITATGEGEVLLYVDGEPVENPYTIARGETDVTVTVTATAQGEGKRISDVATQELVIPAILPKTDMPVISYEMTDEAVIITAAGEGDVLLYVNGELVENPYTVARGEEDVNITITATAQGENKRISDVASMEIIVPAYQVTAVPTITTSIDDNTVTITAAGDGDVLLYVNGELVENPYTIARGNEDVTIEVYATAKEEGKLMSSTEVTEIIIPKKESSVDELFSNKTIANVRYFNMAGQEMQEANGVTIIVTTYTDGTRSTMKVMK